MRATGLLLAATAGLAASQTVDFFFPNVDQQNLLAFSLGSDASATTWLVGCPTDSQSSDCGFPSGMTVTEGPKIAHYTVVYNDVILDLNCKLEPKTSAVCTEIVGGPAVSKTAFHGATSTVFSTSGDLASWFIPATIVANSASILTFDESPTGTILSNTGASSTATKSSSGSAQTLAASSTQTPAISSTQTRESASAPKLTTSTKPSSATVATASSTAGVPQITGSSRWVVGGMAALALAAL